MASAPLLNANAAISLLERCKSMAELRQLHAQMIKSNLTSHTLALSRLVSSYSLSGVPGGLDHAISLFDRIQEPNAFIFYAIIRGFSESENARGSIALYAQMLADLDESFGVEFSIPSVLKACGKASAFEEGHQLHGQILKTHFKNDPFVSNSLLRMYLEFGEVETAKRVFDQMHHQDTISWNSMITGCVKAGVIDLALRVFEEMPDKDVVSWNSMIDGLMKAGMCDRACKLFEMMDRKDVVSWTTMISGYVLNDRPKDALKMFRRMLDSGVRPDAASLVNVLSAIADLGFSQEGNWIYAYVHRSKIKLIHGVLGSALIDMYSKCGLIEDARDVFRIICHERRVGDWNSMISGFAIHGLGREALQVFEEMEKMELQPDEITFVGILNACSHSGLVKEGQLYFKLMSEKYKLEPGIQHYGCLVDLLGRAGQVEEARTVIDKMPIEPDTMVWKSMLSACLKHGNLTIGEQAAMQAIHSAPNDSSSYVLLSNIYARLRRWADVERIRKLMTERGVRKVPGCSSVMVNGKIHDFVIGREIGLGCKEEVLSKLEEVIHRLKSNGYRPDLTQVLVDVKEEEKESLLGVHSEKMAIAFGLIHLERGNSIHIVKNLRVCGDCHSFCKLVSKLYSHEIVLRDQSRFHCFRGGSCSCNDFW